ncbi:MAG: T9SS type A sorting domain-containing protein [Bacteroidia bacterium]
MTIHPPIKFYLLLFIAVFYIKASQAQIVYTNVNPDLTFNGNGAVYHLDLNNDGMKDFDITYSNSFAGPCGDIAQLNYYIRITPKRFNSIGGDSIISLQPLRLDSNSVIDKNLLWRRDPNQLLFSMSWLCQTEYWVGIPNGYWINTAEKFLPLKLCMGGHTYYGWLGIDVEGLNTSFGNFTIKDYAFNSVVNLPIRAGETTCATPVVTVTASGPLAFCAGDSVTLTANTGAYKYQWKLDGINISGATSSTYIAKTAGTYKVKVTNSCGNKTSTAKNVTTPCRLNQNAAIQANKVELDHLAVYPNPAINTVTIHLPTDDESIIQVFDLFGKTVFTGKSISDEMLIDVSDFTTGVYLVKWNCENHNESKTFSVVK